MTAPAFSPGGFGSQSGKPSAAGEQSPKNIFGEEILDEGDMFPASHGISPHFLTSAPSKTAGGCVFSAKHHSKQNHGQKNLLKACEI